MRSIFRSVDTRGRTVALLLIGALAFSGVACEERSENDLAANLLDRGLEEHAAGHLEEAAKAYREVLVHEPNNKFAHYNLGLIDQQNSQKQSAEGHYRQALAADPDFIPALFNLAILLTGDRPEEALSTYRRVIDLKPDDAAAHLNLGFLLISLGRTEDGKAELDTAVRLDPSLASRRQTETAVNPSPAANPTERGAQRSPTKNS